MSIQESNVEDREDLEGAEDASNELSVFEAEFDLDESHLVRGYN
ncbi:hypothetical protein [Saccharopolyspora sp. ASAGF58]|nr:hypothetical protein [Saccharopolyspora sp. ASAGF58]